jgi:hypothetical protein
MAQDAGGRRAEQDPRESRHAVRAHDDDVRALTAGHRADRIDGGALRNVVEWRPFAGRCGRPHECGQLLSGLTREIDARRLRSGAEQRLLGVQHVQFGPAVPGQTGRERQRDARRLGEIDSRENPLGREHARRGRNRRATPPRRGGADHAARRPRQVEAPSSRLEWARELLPIPYQGSMGASPSCPGGIVRRRAGFFQSRSREVWLEPRCS